MKWNINNNLAVLPSHDITLLLSFLILRNFLQLVAWVHYIAYLVVIFFRPFSNSWFFLLNLFFFQDCLHCFSSHRFLTLLSSPVFLHSSPVFLVISFVQPTVTNFIWPYLHQFFDDSHGLKASLKPLKRPFDRYQSHLEAINIGRDIRQINW